MRTPFPIAILNGTFFFRSVKAMNNWKRSAIKQILLLLLMDLEKAYDTIDRHGMWQMLRVYGVRGKLLKAVQSFYVDSRVGVRVEKDVREWFSVNVGLRQGCVMSSWLFNV